MKIDAYVGQPSERNQSIITWQIINGYEYIRVNEKYSKGLSYCKICAKWIQPLKLNSGNYCNHCRKRVRRYAIVRKKNRARLEAQGIIRYV